MSAATLRRAHAVHPITAMQTEYSLCTRNAEIAVLDRLWEEGRIEVVGAEHMAAARAAGTACSEASPLFIAGLSMGGFGALRLAGKYPRRFSAAAGHSSVTIASQLDALMAETRSDWAKTPEDTGLLQALCNADAPLPPLRFDCGRDDPFIDANRQLHADLQAAGIAHEYAEHEGGHDWTYWAKHLEETLHFFGAACRRKRIST